METKASLICSQLLTLVVLSSLTALPAYAQDDLASLQEQKARLALEASIEKSRADIADSIRKQRENQALADLAIRQKQAEARKAEADARKGEALASIPPTEIKALSGSVDVKSFGSAGLVVAVDLAKSLAKDLCGEIKATLTIGKVAVFDAQTASGVIAARALEKQIDLLASSLDGALTGPEEGAWKTFAAAGFDAAIATGAIKAFADLASLFKTNVIATSTDFPDRKRFFVTAMASDCGDRLASLGAGYVGELDPTGMEDLVRKTLKILQDRAKLQARIDELKASAGKEKDPVTKRQLQSQLDGLNAIRKEVDDFMNGIKPGEMSDKSTLAVASRYFAESRRINNAKILDLDITLEGLSIVKSNIFTGQKLRLSATGILSYRIQEMDGTLIKAGVMRRIAKPISVNLRGYDPKDVFWSGAE